MAVKLFKLRYIDVRMLLDLVEQKPFPVQPYFKFFCLIEISGQQIALTINADYKQIVLKGKYFYGLAYNRNPTALNYHGQFYSTQITRVLRNKFNTWRMASSCLQ